MKNIIKLLFTVFLLLFIVILSVKVTLNLKWIYYFDINNLNIEQHTDLNREDIKCTYDYLIYYVTSNKDIQFKIPLLPSSKEAITHFEEVKELFSKFDFTFYLSILFILPGIYFINKCKDFSPLKWCSNIIWISFLLLSTAFYTNFDKSFNFFHRIFFDNDYWLFSPTTDPVINILPQEFFLHCAIMILFLIMLWSVVLRLIYLKTIVSK